jgi:ABC-type multidrug transport system fused ATPase/permease subunit
MHRRRQLLLLLVLMVLVSVSEVVSIGAVVPFLGVLMAPESLLQHPAAQSFVSALDIKTSSELTLSLTTLFVLSSLLSGSMRLILLWAQTRLGFAIGADISLEIYKKTLYQPYSIHVDRNSSEVISGVSTKTNIVIFNILLPFLNASSSALILFAILVALVTIDPIVALVTFGGFGSIYGLIMFFTKKRLVHDSQEISKGANQVIKALQEGLGGIRDVLIDGTQDTYLKIYRHADLVMRHSQANTIIVGASPRFLIESLGIALIAFLAYYLSAQESGMSGAIPVLGALAIGAQRILPALQLLFNSWTNICGGKASLKNVLDLLDQPLPEYVGQQQSSLVLPFQRSISLQQVSFRYTNMTPFVLLDINFEIMKGSRIGFIGTTGSGKSTLLDLIMGLLHAQEGYMAIDSVPINSKNNRAWQAHIAHVPQFIFLADASISENIAFGVSPEKIDMSRVKEAARQAQIEDAIESWEEKYDTFVGERGVRLSGGQRQRIGIARALYKRADVIVFDEATSALDSSTESDVMEAIDKIGKDITILIVAHRLTTLKSCDWIFELEKGRIKRADSYKNIIKQI